MTNLSTPVGIGDFTGCTAGESSGEPLTDAAVDFRWTPSGGGYVQPYILTRYRLAGQDHGMPVQDVLDSVGGRQILNRSYGGLTDYYITTDVIAHQKIAISVNEDTTSGSRSYGGHITRLLKRDLSNTVNQCGPLSADANIEVWVNGEDTVAVLKADGRLVTRIGASLVWTPVLGGFTNNGLGSITISDAIYRESGGMVRVHCKVTCSGGAQLGAVAGTSRINGLPVASLVESGGEWNETQMATDSGHLYSTGIGLLMTTGWSQSARTVIFDCTYPV
jgi:hypothetical protein